MFKFCSCTLKGFSVCANGATSALSTGTAPRLAEGRTSVMILHHHLELSFFYSLSMHWALCARHSVKWDSNWLKVGVWWQHRCSEEGAPAVLKEVVDGEEWTWTDTSHRNHVFFQQPRDTRGPGDTGNNLEISLSGVLARSLVQQWGPWRYKGCYCTVETTDMVCRLVIFPVFQTTSQPWERKRAQWIRVRLWSGTALVQIPALPPTTHVPRGELFVSCNSIPSPV